MYFEYTVCLHFTPEAHSKWPVTDTSNGNSKLILKNCTICLFNVLNTMENNMNINNVVSNIWQYITLNEI